MTTPEDDAKYMSDVRAALLKLGVTPERTQRLGGLPLSPSQVAYAIREYVIKIEKREKSKLSKRKP